MHEYAFRAFVNTLQFVFNNKTTPWHLAKVMSLLALCKYKYIYIVIHYIYIYKQGMKQCAHENVVYVDKTCQIEITTLPLLFFFLVYNT